MRILLIAIMFASVVLPAHALPSVASGSYYHPKFEGRLMACGGRFDSEALTAASNNHPCGTRLLVTYNNRDVVVEVTDRCGRCGIDLTRAAAREIGLLRIGRAPVQVERLTTKPRDGADDRPGPPAPTRAVEAVWIKPSSPADDGLAGPPKNKPLAGGRVSHVGAVPTAPIPSFWIMHE